MPPASSALVKPSTLPPVLASAFTAADLYDPSTISDKDQENSAAAIVAGSALAFLLPLFEGGLFVDLALSTVLGGGLAAYFSMRKDPVGAITRDVIGDSANSFALTTAKNIEFLEEELEISANVKKNSKKLVDDIAKKVKDF